MLRFRTSYPLPIPSLSEIPSCRLADSLPSGRQSRNKLSGKSDPYFSFGFVEADGGIPRCFLAATSMYGELGG